MRQLQLIQLYYYVCQCYDKHACLHFQRQSNNYQPLFTDQELIMIYLFGTINKHFRTAHIYAYLQAHWLDWFPYLPSYQAFNYRLNQLYWQLEVITTDLLSQVDFSAAYPNLNLIDSMPVIVSKRADKAKVALNVADKGYCSRKDLYYHGLKLHLLGRDSYQSLPVPEAVRFTAASVNDWTAAKPLCYQIKDRIILADKIYGSQSDTQALAQQEVYIITPVKRKKGQICLQAADKILSSWVSSIRQPIESLINQHTQLQNASHVRSENGLWLHCWGKIASALFLIVFYP